MITEPKVPQSVVQDGPAPEVTIADDGTITIK